MTNGNSEPQTCGKGLADHSAVIDNLAAYATENANVLEAHLGMLDESDPASAEEGVLYRDLVSELRQASSLLRAAAARMQAARALPMGRHLDSPDANATMMQAFRRFVDAASALGAALSARMPADRAMLAEME